jgi:hypothetical protein
MDATPVPYTITGTTIPGSGRTNDSLFQRNLENDRDVRLREVPPRSSASVAAFSVIPKIEQPHSLR